MTTATATLYEQEPVGAVVAVDGAVAAPSPTAVGFEVLRWTPEEVAVLGAGRRLSGSQWFERHGVRIDGDRALRLSLDLTPYLREVADCCCDNLHRSVDFRCSTQVGKSTLLRTMLGCWFDQDPSSVLLGFPSDDDAHDFNELQVIPTFLRTRVLRRLLPPEGTAEFRSSCQRRRLVSAAGTIHAVGLQKAKSAKSRVCRRVALDEVDEIPDDVGDQGDPVELAEERQRTTPDPMTLCTGTYTTTEGRLWRRRRSVTDRRRFFVPCPRCGERGVLAKRRDPDMHGDSPVFELGWSEGLTVEHAGALTAGALDDSVWLVCPHCREKVYERDRLAMVARGRYVSAVPDPDDPEREVAETIDADGVIHSVSPEGEAVSFAPGDTPTPRTSRFRRVRAGFTVNAFYSPWLSLGAVLGKFLEAKAAGVVALKNFINSWLAEPWRESAQRLERKALRRRCVAPEHLGGGVPEWARAAGLDRLEHGELPPWTKMLTMACDTQADGWWWSVMAWGAGRRRHLVARGFAPGAEADIETGKPAGWLELERVWSGVWATPDRMDGPALRLMVDAVGIDSGGDKTYDIYDLCAEYPEFLWPTKGRDVGGVRQGDNLYKLVPVPYRTEGGADVGGVAHLMEIDVNQVKSQVARDLRADFMAPGAVTFHAGCLDPSSDCFTQLTAEERVVELVGRPGRGRARDERAVWRARHGNNHEFDLQVIHAAVAVRRGVLRFTEASAPNSPAPVDPAAMDPGAGRPAEERGDPEAEAPRSPRSPGERPQRGYAPERLPNVRDGFGGGGLRGGGVGGGGSAMVRSDGSAGIERMTASQVSRAKGVARQTINGAELGALRKLRLGFLADPVLREVILRMEREL